MNFLLPRDLVTHQSNLQPTLDSNVFTYQELSDIDAFGQDWQVLDTDPKLFQNMDRIPQYPQKCILPEATMDTQRRLGASIAKTRAEEACSHAEGGLQEDCVFDVMATGDVELAESY